MNNLQIINLLLDNDVDFNLFINPDEMDQLIEAIGDKATAYYIPNIPNTAEDSTKAVLIIDRSDIDDGDEQRMSQKDIIAKLTILGHNHPKSVIWITSYCNNDNLPDDQLCDNLNKVFIPITSIYD